MDSSFPVDDLGRFARQVCFEGLGVEGQRRLRAGRALVCGCGALGSIVAGTLVRAGAGLVRIVDPDVVEEVNLQRQVLFDEQDAASRALKVTAAAAKLRLANSDVTVEPILARATHENIFSLCEGIDVIVDATDNFPSRFLLNDASIHLNIPWIYGGCLGAQGQTMTILPGRTACLRCLMPECPLVEATPTCVTAGILGPIVGVIASIEALEAIKILSGREEAVSRNLTVIDLWTNKIRQINTRSLRDQVDCPACKQGQLSWLSGSSSPGILPE
ncbi:MAG: ThiF family adenylyltransferase [Pirellulales bacterium]|nr:ThiF family adenylyltransferase [Pirellulales bacterium]